MEDQNCVIGENPTLKNSVVKFVGKNNILFCEKDVILVNSEIIFNGSNSLIYLSSNKHEYKLGVTINNNQVCFFGKHNYMNGKINIILSEEKHIFIGGDNLLSFGIWMRNADPHLIYDSKTKKRINPTKSIFVGDHVWIGQSALILKGTIIGSGSIVGAMSVVSGITIPSNECWGGVSAKRLKTGVFWEGSCVHSWTELKTQKSQIYEEDTYIYNKNLNNLTSYNEIDIQLSNAKTSNDKLGYILELVQINEKNRFAIL